MREGLRSMVLVLAAAGLGGCGEDSAPNDAGSGADASGGADASITDRGPPPPDFGCPANPPPATIGFESRFQTVLGAQMHYYESGPSDGPVVLLLHGIPVSAYFWRNVIPHLDDRARVIALDHIGFGQSERPAGLDFGLEDQVAYLDGFIDALSLDELIVVGQDMGSWVGMTWVSRNPDRVRAVALVEGIIPPLLPVESASADPNLLGIWRAARDPVQAEGMFIENNFFLDVVLPQFTACGLSDEALATYRAPWVDPESRRILIATPAELPIDGQPAGLAASVQQYVDWIESSPVPKLLVHAEPGALMPASVIDVARERMPNVTTTSVGGGVHFLAESKPGAVGAALSDWLDDIL